MIAGVLVASAVSVWLGADGSTLMARKILVVVQVLLPLAGLLLGQLVDQREKTIARSFLIVISLVVPCQLLATEFLAAVVEVEIPGR